MEADQKLDLVFFDPIGHAGHAEAGHPERPERVAALQQALEQAGWWQTYPHLNPLELPQDVLGGVHAPAYLRLLEEASRSGRRLDADTYTTPLSWQLALNAAGGALSVSAAVWQRRARRGFALTRPPGHHATRSRGMGFCLLNNVALAAEYLIRYEGAQRLAILDLDLHHGNGTQDIFWERGDVFYLSTHQSPLYPGTGYLDETGAGAGQGANANLPLPPGSGDQAFETALETWMLPLLDRFQAEMLLVSFGFDPHWRDPLGHLQLSAGGYGQLLAGLAAWADAHCQGRIALFLEGGYDLEAGRACAAAVTAALLGQKIRDPLGPSPHAEGRSWQAVLRQARQVWGI